MQIINNRINLSVLLIILSSCSTGSDYKKPDIKVPDKFDTSLTNNQKKSNPEWWRDLNDEELNELINTALLGNLDLKIAYSRKLASQNEVQKARSKYFPQISLTPSLGLDYNNTTNASDTYQLPLAISYELDLWGKISDAVEISKLEVEVQNSLINAAKLSLIADVASNYYQLRTLEITNLLQLTKVEYQEKLVDLLKQKKVGGLVEQAFVDTQEQQLYQLRIQLAQNNALQYNLKNNLAILLGKNIGELKIAANNKSRIRYSDLEFAINTPSELLDKRPDIIQAQIKLNQASKSIHSEKVNFLPSFSLSSSVGYSSDDLKNISDSDSFISTNGLTIDQTVFDAGNKQAIFNKSKNEYDISLIEYKKTVFTALKETQEILNEYESLEKQKVERYNFLKNNIDLQDKTESMKKYGLKSNIDVYYQRIRVIDELIAYKALNLEIINNRIKLAKAVAL